MRKTKESTLEVHRWLNVQCPTCHSKEGHWCQSVRKGSMRQRIAKPHAARTAKADTIASLVRTIPREPGYRSEHYGQPQASRGD